MKYVFSRLFDQWFLLYFSKDAKFHRDVRRRMNLSGKLPQTVTESFFAYILCATRPFDPGRIFPSLKNKSRYRSPEVLLEIVIYLYSKCDPYLRIGNADQSGFIRKSLSDQILELFSSHLGVTSSALDKLMSERLKLYAEMYRAKASVQQFHGVLMHGIRINIEGKGRPLESFADDDRPMDHLAVMQSLAVMENVFMEGIFDVLRDTTKEVDEVLAKLTACAPRS